MRNQYERLEIWKRSKSLAIELIQETEGVKFYYLKNQIGKSAVSVASNIAEGADRRSGREFIQFLTIARGSLAELYTQVDILSEVDSRLKDKCIDWLQEISQIRYMVIALMKKKMSIN
jgi:four helix bundle protein